jgi:hypothetical protein
LVPGQDGVRPGYIGHFAENLATQSMADLAERGSLGVRELQPPFQMSLQDAIFGSQIFIPCQQLLVHRPGDVSRSGVVDWQFAPKWDVYLGVMSTSDNGGLANGFLKRNNIATTAGLRFRF